MTPLQDSEVKRMENEPWIKENDGGIKAGGAEDQPPLEISGHGVNSCVLRVKYFSKPHS